MFGVTDLKKDTIIQIDGVPFKVVEYAQKQMGRGGSIVNVKLKNLLDGSVIPKTYKGNDKIEPAEVTSRKAQYLYSDTDQSYFMDQESFEQFNVANNLIGDNLIFLKEGQEVNIQFFGSQIISIDLPTKIELRVVEAPEVTRGDTQSTVLKEVTLETGAKVQTPMFIKSGEVIVVDTRDQSYVERAKN